MKESLKQAETLKIDVKQADSLLETEMNEVVGGAAADLEDAKTCGCILFARA